MSAHDDELLPQIDFATFLMSLCHSALVQLGAEPHPETGTFEANLALAKQQIDILGMLEEKTKGNLSGAEERLLAEMLFDLRMRYVERTKATTP